MTPNKRIIIEGCDGVGKDTFIQHFLAYIQGKSINGENPLKTFNGKNFIEQTSDELVRKRDGMTLNTIWPETQENIDRFHAEADRYPKRFHTGTSKWVPRWGTIYSAASFHSSDGSPESKAFIDKLNAGEITDQDFIAKEYLQVHYDLENACKRADEVLDIVIHNRSLCSYYAMQIHALGLKEHAENWGKLWRYAEQKSGIFIHLVMPEDALRERLRKRQGEDFRGEVENLYMSKAAKINEGFEIIKKTEDWFGVFTIDVNKPIEAYAEDFERILQFRNSYDLRLQAGI